MSKFEFTLDPGRRLLTIVLHGFWTVQDYEAYSAQLTTHLMQLRQFTARQACLVDARDFAVQSKEVADCMRHGIAKRLSLYPERTARVISCAISRQQAARMTDSCGHGVFESTEQALDWLLERHAQAA